MLIEPADLIASLGLPADSSCDEEPLTERPGGPERIRIRSAGREPLVVVVRRPFPPEAAMNHAAVSEALERVGFEHAPRLLAVSDGVTVESWAAGASALSFVPPPGSCSEAMAVFAQVHELPVREGLDWERLHSELVPPAELPMHRLGYAAEERERVAPALAAAHDALLGGPFGFAHRDATAGHVLLRPGGATLINFRHAGLGPQLVDVAAFLLTAGLDATSRAGLSGEYAMMRGLPPRATVDLIDLAGIAWGFEFLLGLPRRLVEALGDDGESAALHTAAARVDAGVREAAGEHPVAAAIRRALWQG